MELKEKFDFYIENGFDYHKSLKRNNLKHEELSELRSKLLNIPCIPKLIYDKHVSAENQLTVNCVTDFLTIPVSSVP